MLISIHSFLLIYHPPLCHSGDDDVNDIEDQNNIARPNTTLYMDNISTKKNFEQIPKLLTI